MNLYRLFPPTRKGEKPAPAIWFRKKIKATLTYNEMVRHVNGQPQAYDDTNVSLEEIYSKLSPAKMMAPILNGEDWIASVKLLFNHKIEDE